MNAISKDSRHELICMRQKTLYKCSIHDRLTKNQSHILYFFLMSTSSYRTCVRSTYGAFSNAFQCFVAGNAFQCAFSDRCCIGIDSSYIGTHTLIHVIREWEFRLQRFRYLGCPEVTTNKFRALLYNYLDGVVEQALPKTLVDILSWVTSSYSS
jgi:hypothetical protein